MAEPTKKKNKGRHAPSLALVGDNLQPNIKKPTESDAHTGQKILTFWTQHPTEPRLVDLNEFATGRKREELPAKSRKGWAGDYSGRPELIAQLQPFIEQEWMFYGRLTVRQALSSLRAWWRVLDEAERVPGEASKLKVSRLNGVEELHELYYAVSRRLNIDIKQHTQFMRLANLRRQHVGLPTLYWPSPGDDRKDTDAPTHWEMEAIRHKLKHGWFAVLDRWEHADRNPADLSSWKKFSNSTQWKDHAHSIYRAVIELVNDPLPTMAQIATAIGYQKKVDWMWPLGPLQAGLYPTGEDVRYAFHIALLYSGWNVQTLLDLDVTGRFVEEHPTNPEYHLVYGFKNRGDSEHFCLGRTKRTDSIGTILRTIVDRTKPLRREVRKELICVRKSLRKDKQNSELIDRKIELTLTLKSPWLFADPMGRGVRRLTNSNVNTEFQTTFLRRIIIELNKSQPEDRKVRESITPSDFRDAYIGFAYEFSNYSILAAKVAATHRQATTTQRYLRHKAWRAHSASKVRHLSTEMWTEIQIYRQVDPAVLRAKMDFGSVSDIERERLKVYRHGRTRIGVGCRDFKNPPADISPEHVEGSGCRVQRCNLCRKNRILYDDSYDHISRRQAELEDIRDKIPVTAWSQSSFPEELEMVEQDLELFDAGLVQDRLNFWRTEIRSGRHTPITMEGAYA